MPHFLLTIVNLNKGLRQLQVSSLYRHEAYCGIVDDGPTVPHREWCINARFVSMTKSIADLGILQVPHRSTQRFAGPNKVSCPLARINKPLETENSIDVLSVMLAFLKNVSCTQCVREDTRAMHVWLEGAGHLLSWVEKRAERHSKNVG